MSSKERTILNLSIGESAVITHFSNSIVSEKMIEMGGIPGSTIQFLQQAPFGDPLLIQLDNCQLTIRKEEAKYVQISELK